MGETIKYLDVIFMFFGIFFIIISAICFGISISKWFKDNKTRILSKSILVKDGGIFLCLGECLIFCGIAGMTRMYWISLFGFPMMALAIVLMIIVTRECKKRSKQSEERLI